MTILLTKYSTLLFLALPTALSSRITHGDDKKAAMDEDRDDFDEKMLWGGDDDFDMDDDVFDDWHPDELEDDVREERFARLVKKMDENGDGKITRHELMHWTLRALQNMDSRELAEDFTTADNDGDGKVSWHEYVENIFGIESDKVDDFTLKDVKDNPEIDDFNRVYNRENAKFIAADANEDGFLNEEEYELFYNPGKEPESTQFAITEAMRAVDKDSDGMLNMDEFLNDYKVAGHAPDDDHLDAMRDIFHQMDINGNSRLDGDELILWIQQDNGEIAADEAQHLIDTADDNEDGWLSYEEVHNAMEDFIESDATEYGYMLRHDEL